MSSLGQIAQTWVNNGGPRNYARLMARIAMRESGGRAKANNAGLNKNGTVDHGWFQINDIWRNDPDIKKIGWSNRYDPDANTRMAIVVLRKQGPKAWATFNAGVDKKYLGGFKGGPSDLPKQANTITRTSSSAEGDTNQAIIQALLSKRKVGGGLLQTIVDSTPAPTRTTATERRPSRQGGGLSAEAAGGSVIQQLVARANAIDRKKMPYLWGGGHGGKVDAFKASPLDCSGAVSAVLGINPRVSGQFTTWGKPGRAKGGRGVTVYANATHVLMEINGHFFGTSKANPGGGAGWIERRHIKPGYLRRFTARHM